MLFFTSNSENALGTPLRIPKKDDLKDFEYEEMDQKYEETNLKFEETDQQIEIFKVFEKSRNGSKI